jgi:hypothetical protein
VSDPPITCAPCPDTTSEAELNALASAYKFVLDSRAKKEAAPKAAPNAGKETNERSGKTSIPR